MRVYLDWNATTPPLPAALEAMATAAADAWGNPASVHGHGRAARACVEGARAALGALAEVDARDVVLTSGGTEANNLAVRSAFAGREPASRDVLVTSRLEHPSITRVAEALERAGLARLYWLRVTPAGTIDVSDLEAALARGDVRLVTVQAVNHETGVLQPVAEVAEVARAHDAWLHVDAVQGWGKVSFPLRAADTYSLAGHKFRGPKGIGALFTRAGVRLEPVLQGGAQERGLRPGTVDPVASAGLGIAATHARVGPARYAAVAELRDDLEQRVLAAAPGSSLNGSGSRAPHVSNLSIPGWTGPELVAALDLEGISISSGSACSAGTSEPSPVLTAMFGEARAASSIRLSLGETTTAEDVSLAAAAFERVLARG